MGSPCLTFMVVYVDAKGISSNEFMKILQERENARIPPPMLPIPAPLVNHSLTKPIPSLRSNLETTLPSHPMYSMPSSIWSLFSVLDSMTQVFVAGYVYHLIQIKIRPTLSSLCTQNVLWKERKKSNISKHIMLKRLWQQNLITQLSTFLLRGFNQAYKCVTSSTIPFYLFTA